MSEKIWEIYPDVADRVQTDHERSQLVGGHDYIHAFRVGETARRIGLNEWENSEIADQAGIAGLAHNADRILQKIYNADRRDIGHEDIQKLIHTWIADQVSFDDCDTIVEAVLLHDHQNAKDDSEVLTALKDADRVVNLDIDLFPRSGQHYSDLPVVDYEHFLNDPEATYRNPKTILRDIAYSLDWVDPGSPVCVRTELGKTMAEARAKVFRTFFDALREQLKEEGIDVPFAR